VITQLGVYRFGTDGQMELAGLQPGVDEGTVDGGTGWAMRRAPNVERIPEPSAGTLAAIRGLVA